MNFQTGKVSRERFFLPRFPSLLLRFRFDRNRSMTKKTRSDYVGYLFLFFFFFSLSVNETPDLAKEIKNFQNSFIVFGGRGRGGEGGTGDATNEIRRSRDSTGCRRPKTAIPFFVNANWYVLKCYSLNERLLIVQFYLRYSRSSNVKKTIKRASIFLFFSFFFFCNISFRFVFFFFFFFLFEHSLLVLPQRQTLDLETFAFVS